MTIAIDRNDWKKFSIQFYQVIYNILLCLSWNVVEFVVNGGIQMKIEINR